MPKRDQTTGIPGWPYPQSALQAIGNGHQVIVETGAGAGAGFSDEEYTDAGAGMVDTAAEVFATAEMIVKVKE